MNSNAVACACMFALPTTGCAHNYTLLFLPRTLRGVADAKHGSTILCTLCRLEVVFIAKRHSISLPLYT